MIETEILQKLKDIFNADDFLKDFPLNDVNDRIVDSGLYRIILDMRSYAINQGIPIYKIPCVFAIMTDKNEDKDRTLINAIFTAIHNIIKNKNLLNEIAGVDALDIDEITNDFDDEIQIINISTNIFFQE